MAALRAISQPSAIYRFASSTCGTRFVALLQKSRFAWPPTAGLPSIVLPFYPYKSGLLDELYPSPQNLWAVSLHIFLIFTQATFLLLLIPSLFFGVPVPLFGWTPSCILTIVGFVAGNKYFCILLNGTKRRYQSIVNTTWKKHDEEKWIFINGVAVGDHWMQSNLDRLALTFRRPIHGIHNKTRGIIFDVVECIIQRTFGYATPDVRAIYADVMNFIKEEKDDIAKYSKVVLILHSQGAVEGGLVLDWLFASLEQELLNKLEIYTFGSAANHFNSPEMNNNQRVVKHIEHYANLGDYVSRFGILHFRPLPRAGAKKSATSEAQTEIENRYVGRLFVRKGSGHQLNGNYLDNFFEMDMNDKGELTKVKEDNEYMSSKLDHQVYQQYDIASKDIDRDLWNCSSSKDKSNTSVDRDAKIKGVSRLWQYRNGMSPDDGVRASTWPVAGHATT